MVAIGILLCVLGILAVGLMFIQTIEKICMFSDCKKELKRSVDICEHMMKLYEDLLKDSLN